VVCRFGWLSTGCISSPCFSRELRSLRCNTCACWRSRSQPFSSPDLHLRQPPASLSLAPPLIRPALQQLPAEARLGRHHRPRPLHPQQQAMKAQPQAPRVWLHSPRAARPHLQVPGTTSSWRPQMQVGLPLCWCCIWVSGVPSFHAAGRALGCD
jgi:hypothetical protein